MVIIMVIEDYWDGENWLEFHENNNSKMYILNEQLHRENGPAVIYYFKNGKIQVEIYLKNDQLHRENGPAKIRYNIIGNIEEKHYYQNGKRHREDGPAIIHYNIIGNIEEKHYYQNGTKIILEDLSFKFPIDTDEKKLYMKLKYGDNNGN